MGEEQIVVGDRVSFELNKKTVEAKVLVVRPNSNVAKIAIVGGTGQPLTVSLDELTKLRRGFKQYDIIWSKGEKGQDNINFRFSVTSNGMKVDFHGWWRKSEVTGRDGRKEPCYCIDIYCKWGDKSCALKSIPYFVTDPRTDVASLNADITAAANEFVWKTLNGKVSIISKIAEMAARPVVHIKNMRTLDGLIQKLMEHRASSIGVGGPRHCDIQSDEEGGPRVVFAIDLTLQHVALDGRVPSIVEGAVYDTAGKGKISGQKLELKMDEGNLNNLIAQLKKAKESGDESGARKIRAVLRKLGHKGGARSVGK